MSSSAREVRHWATHWGVVILSLLVLASCARTTTTNRTVAPAPQLHIGPDSARIVALISANTEWKIIRALYPGPALHESPFGQWFTQRVASEDVVFFHGGYGKVAAAGSTQYAINRWRPRMLINLGTCGGFGGERKPGDIMLINETYIYDIVELMGDASEAIEDHHIMVDTAYWPERLAPRVIRGPIVSADRDLDPAAVDELGRRYRATVGDWESAAIAWVAVRNRTPVLILRGVTDVIDATGNNPTYNAIAEWEQASVGVMRQLVSLLGEAMPELSKSLR